MQIDQREVENKFVRISTHFEQGCRNLKFVIGRVERHILTCT